MPPEDIAPRVSMLEQNHSLLSQELKYMNGTLRKIETAIERQNEISADIRLLRQALDSHIVAHDASIKRQNERIERMETNQTRVVWILVLAVSGALLDLILVRN